MEIVVTGGTGFVGREIVHRLVAAGHHPRLLVRPGRGLPAGPGSAPEIGRLETDFTDPARLGAQLRGAEAVIHLVGIISECGSQTFARVHIDLTRRVLAAAREAGIPRFVHMSALGTRPGARSRYHLTKWAAEEIVHSSGMAWTIFRPSLIYGPGDAFTNLFAELGRRSPVVPVMGGGRNRLQPVAVGQVARAFAGAVSDPRATGITYDLCGPEVLTFREVIRSILAATGRRRPLLTVPFPLARLPAALLEAAYPALLRRPPPLNRDQLLMLQEDNTGDGSRADRDFGLDHPPFREALAAQFGRG